MSSTFLEPRALRAGSNSGSFRVVLANTIRRPFAWIEHQRRIRRDINLLMSLDDHALADIGLNRSEVFYAVRRGRLPEPPPVSSHQAVPTVRRSPGRSSGEMRSARISTLLAARAGLVAASGRITTGCAGLSAEGSRT